MRKIFVFTLIFLWIGFANTIMPGGRETVKKIPVKTGYIEWGEARFYYEESGKGLPLVMLHGGGLDCRMWDGQFNTFARYYRVIRYDARRHGRSTSGPGTYSFHEDLRYIMDKLGIKKAVIMGLSLGGYTAIDFALKYPERVSALVPAAPGLTGYDFKSKAFSKYMEQYRKAAGEKDKEAMTEAFLAGWTDGPYRKPSQVNPAIRKKVKNMILGTYANSSPRGRQERLEPAAVNRLNELRVPTLAIAGTLDMPGIIEIVNLIEKNVPGAKKVLIKDVAHMLNMEKPGEFNRIVLDFLTSLSSKNVEK